MSKLVQLRAVNVVNYKIDIRQHSLIIRSMKDAFDVMPKISIVLHIFMDV